VFAQYTVLLTVWVHIAGSVSIISTYSVLPVFLEDNSSLPEGRAELPRSEAQENSYTITTMVTSCHLSAAARDCRLSEACVQNLATWQLKYHAASSVHFSTIQNQLELYIYKFKISLGKREKHTSSNSVDPWKPLLLSTGQLRGGVVDMYPWPRALQ
jgi:hypothetical protein